ncbi:alpha/beta hydrolase [Pedobacter duraquae]|uniref:AB hydrolase-1 domain-containing protein n=1 Tax=Pedobacter duraquae TaxID=425511 RepID=A0A4V3C445_9SPHI|nr:alpha/beta fold hydrolase [Pedobacter duraquae]TDO24538.1 hypothetical protein CLV32_0827 [Pedobacter duraquae]
MKNSIIIILLCCGFSLSAQDKVFQISSDSVSFKSADGQLTFGGTLTKPIGKKSFPTLVFLSGTGKQDRDGTMAGHKIFLEIATYLSQHGIAVLRTDDRGVGKTTGVYETATTGNFAEDALTAIAYLKNRKDINPATIGLIGHSEGGASMSIAAAQSKDVKFLISLSGVAMSGLDNLYKQNEDLVAASALPDYDKKRSNEINTIMFKVAYKYANSDSMEVKLNETYQTWKLKDDAYFKTLNIQFDHFRFPIYSYVRTAIGPWYRYFIQYDAPKTIGAIKVPILAINGDKDLYVAADSNLANWKSYAAAGGNNNVTTIKMPGLNHLLLPCQTCDAAEYTKIQSGVSPEVLAIIKNWIDKTIR